MGCDIHCYIEGKIDGQWALVSAPNQDRSYALFAALCGVRSYDEGIEPFCDTRDGIPDDASPALRAYNRGWELDAHSYVCVNGKDFNRLAEHLKKQCKATDEHSAIMRALTWRDWPCGLGYKDLRLVCWFDN